MNKELFNHTPKNKKLIEISLVFAIIAAAILLSIWQTIIYLLQTPDGFYFPLVHNYIQDYYYYLHVIKQGFDGSFLATSRLTPEMTQPQFVAVFFLVLGQIAKAFHLSIPLVYFLARISGGFFLLLASYKLILITFPSSILKRIAALLSIIFSSYWWGVKDGVVTIAPLVREWNELDLTVRLTFIPHHLWSKVFMVFALLQLLKMRKERKLAGYFILILLVSLMGFTSPVALTTFLPVVGLWMGLGMAVKFLHLGGVMASPSTSSGSARHHVPPASGLLRCLKAYFPFIIAIIVGLSVAFYHRIIQNGVFPWTLYLAWENSVRYPITIFSYLQALGPAFILFFVGVPNLWRKEGIGQMLTAWGFSGLLMLFVLGPFIPLSNIRYLGGYQFIPIGIGAIEGLDMITNYILIKIQKSRLRPAKPDFVGQAKVKTSTFATDLIGASADRQNYNFKVKNIKLVAWLIIFIVLFGYSAIGFRASFRQQMSYVNTNRSNPQIYLSKELSSVFAYLDKNSKPGAVVIAPEYISTMLPAFTKNRVVAGHLLMTANFEKKAADIASFYSFSDPKTAQEIIRQYNIKYLLISQNTQISESSKNLFPAPVYENKEWKIIHLAGSDPARY